MKKKTTVVLLLVFIIIAGAAVGTIFFLSQPQLSMSPGIVLGIN